MNFPAGLGFVNNEMYDVTGVRDKECMYNPKGNY